MYLDVPTADRVVEAELNDCCQRLEQLTEGHVLLISAPIYDDLDTQVRDVVEARCSQSAPPDRLSVVLTTSGGLLEPVRRIVGVLRRHYQEVDFLIPDHAYSAGTVLAMSGDEIYMDYFSRLGPIDPQVMNNEGRFVPALGYLEKWSELIEKARKGTLTQAELHVILSFDQAELHRFEQAKNESIKLLKEWLVEYKFKDWTKTQDTKKRVTKTMKERRAVKIAKILNDTRKWHSHGYGISREILERDVYLKIQDLDTPKHRDILKALRRLHQLTEDYMLKVRAYSRVHSSEIHQTRGRIR